MRVLTTETMRQVEAKAEQAGVAPGLLMEVAGRRVAEEACRIARPGQRLGVLVGPGQNGGDGLVAARHLAAWGWSVGIVTPKGQGPGRGAAAEAARALRTLHPQVSWTDDARGFDLYVDALLGTGARGPARPAVAAVIQQVAATGRPVLAVDLPSGVDADTGAAAGDALEAQVTVALGHLKPGHLFHPGRQLAGEVVHESLSLPQPVSVAGDPFAVLSPCEARDLLPPRAPTGHKGTHGRVLVVAGSLPMAGAATLAAMGALRSGAGLVTVAVPACIQERVAARVLSALTMSLPDANGMVGAQACEILRGAMARADVVVAGPGLGRGAGAAAVVSVLAGHLGPVLLDADALRLLAPRDQAPGPRIVTPHAGEAGAVLGTGAPVAAHDRVTAARDLARMGTVLLKGAPTLVAQASGPIWLNPTGNPGLGVGGSGDVLAGLVGGLWAQGLSPMDAARLGAYLHGLAGDILAREAPRGFTSEDVASALPRAFAALLAGSAT